MASAARDLESGSGGLPHSETINFDSPARALSSTPVPHSAPHNLDADAGLARFRYLLGIHRDPGLAGDERPSANKGIYERVIEAEQGYSKKYKIYAVLINRCLPHIPWPV